MKLRPPPRSLSPLFLVFCLSASGNGQEQPKKSEVETADEKTEKLHRKLDESLSEFDALILREQEILERRREAAAAAGGGAGAGEPEVGGGESAGGGKDEGTSDSEEDASTIEAGTGGSPADSGGEPSSEPEASTEDPEAASADIDNGRVPPDVGDGRDDDIVARQLREAAMKEEDPELREKLWDEYRAYKFGEKKQEKKETGS
jgi:hypothetical protein